MDEDGGPAFPVGSMRAEDGSIGHQDSHSTWQFGGMTLRDYFAIRAPLNLLDRVGLLWSAERDAEARYKYADAMLKARASAANSGGSK
jgi:hypothetical protein